MIIMSTNQVIIIMIDMGIAFSIFFFFYVEGDRISVHNVLHACKFYYYIAYI